MDITKKKNYRDNFEDFLCFIYHICIKSYAYTICAVLGFETMCLKSQKLRKYVSEFLKTVKKYIYLCIYTCIYSQNFM